MTEVWKPVNVWDGAFADYYEVSNLGNVRSYYNNRWGRRKEPKLLRPANPQRDFYRSVNLKALDGTHRSFCIHQLVASAFIPNPRNCKYINHKDGNKKNNVVENLEWCTQKENMEHASKMNLMKGRQIREIATGKEYPTIYEAARQLDCSTSYIYDHLQGYKNQKGKIIYEYVI